MSARRIRVSCEINFSGCDVEDVYYDLPDGWDDMSAKEQEKLLVSYAVEELGQHATSGASVVDENGEDAS